MDVAAGRSARTRRTSGRTSRARCCRESPSTPLAITIGDGCGVWYRTARATISVGGAGRTNGANGVSGFSIARPTSISRRCGVDGIGPLPCEAQHLAVRRAARLRQPARDELHVAAQVVGGAQVDEPPLDRRLAEEHRRRRVVAGDLVHARRDEAVEAGEVFSAPLHATATWRSPGCSCAVACASARSCMTRRPASTAASTAAPATTPTATSASRCPPVVEPGGHEAQREGEAAKLRHRYSHYTGVEDPMSPRYDVPNAAPAPLREVQLFVNSIDRENGVEWLPEWLAENGLEAQLGRAPALRESLRALVVANNALPLEAGAVEAFNAAAARLRLELDETGRARVGGGRATRSTGSSRSHSGRCSTARGRGSRRAATAAGRSTTARRTARARGARCSCAVTAQRRARTGVVSRRRCRVAACGCALPWAASPSRPARGGAWRTSGPSPNGLLPRTASGSLVVGLFTTALVLTHAAMQLPAGRLCDRYGPGWSERPVWSSSACTSLVGLGRREPVARDRRPLRRRRRARRGVRRRRRLRPRDAWIAGRAGLLRRRLDGGGRPRARPRAALAGLARARSRRRRLVAAAGLVLVASRRPIAGVRPWSARAEVRSPPRPALSDARGLVRHLGRARELGGDAAPARGRRVGEVAGIVGGLVLLLGVVSRPLGGHLLGRPGIVRMSFIVGGVALGVLAAARPLPLAVAAAVVVGLAAGIPFAWAFAGAQRLRPDAPAAAVGTVNLFATVVILVGTPLVGLTFSIPGDGRVGFAVAAVLFVAATLAVGRSSPSPDRRFTVPAVFVNTGLSRCCGEAPGVRRRRRARGGVRIDRARDAELAARHRRQRQRLPRGSLVLLSRPRLAPRTGAPCTAPLGRRSRGGGGRPADPTDPRIPPTTGASYDRIVLDAADAGRRSRLLDLRHAGVGERRPAPRRMRRGTRSTSRTFALRRPSATAARSSARTGHDSPARPATGRRGTSRICRSGSRRSGRRWAPTGVIQSAATTRASATPSSRRARHVHRGRARRVRRHRAARQQRADHEPADDLAARVPARDEEGRREGFDVYAHHPYPSSPYEIADE